MKVDGSLKLASRKEQTAATLFGGQMKVKVEPPTAEDEANFALTEMKRCWEKVNDQIAIAAFLYKKLEEADIDPAVKQEVWFEFNATQRRLMKEAMK